MNEPIDKLLERAEKEPGNACTVHKHTQTHTAMLLVEISHVQHTPIYRYGCDLSFKPVQLSDVRSSLHAYT